MIKSALCILALLLCSSSLSAQSVSVDHVDGEVSPGVLASNTPITFHIRFTLAGNGDVSGFTNGFEFYSKDGAQWDPLSATPTGALATYYGSNLFVNEFSNNGQGVDTIGFGGFDGTGTSKIPANYSGIVLTISTQISSSFTGKSFCIDSAFYDPGGRWLWSTNAGDQFPDWGGPYCYGIDSPTAADDENDRGLPTEFALLQNSPNPFNPTTEIRFQLPHRSDYRLTIHNIVGQVVREYSGSAPAGELRIDFDGSDLASGLYFYRIEASDFVASRKMLLLK